MLEFHFSPQIKEYTNKKLFLKKHISFYFSIKYQYMIELCKDYSNKEI